jgi:quinoprotein glucose dehydrogenase
MQKFKTFKPLFVGRVKFKVMALSLVLLCVVFGFTAESQSQSIQAPIPEEPVIEPASEEGQAAISQFKFPANVECEMIAAEPDVANIVAFHRDYQGNIYVCETFRQGKGVEDNRNHAHWMDEELAAQTVQDRIDYVRKYIPDADKTYTAKDDRIRLLKDTDGNGKPDSITVFSDRFNQLEMGTGAGVLSYRGKVYYTCIPDLFELQDADGDGVAEIRKSLHTGYGVRYAFRGHDMHGLIVGPDGRLYFSIGDRGYNLSPAIKDPASGAVFRCELDGSQLEVIATGFRNPQELAFDDFGNLFSGDNNSDSGDKARWVEIIEGGDTGWRMYYQYQQDRGPFNREKIWYPFNDKTPAYIIPPIANIADGPSGLEYYPGTGFGEDFRGRFFLCDFRGAAAQSGIRSWRNKAKGAYWEVVEDEKPFWNMLVTDLDFGSDGKLYTSDWVFGWEGENKGRIYSFADPKIQETAIVKQVESLLRQGLQSQPVENLRVLISHPDQRVRMESQFELVARHDLATLKSIAVDAKVDTLGRLHAIWGIGQLARVAQGQQVSFESSFLKGLLRDEDAEVNGAACGIVADSRYTDNSVISGLLSHENLRVRYRAAMALAKVGTDGDVDAVVKMLVDNADSDPIVRHGGIMALNGIYIRSALDGSERVANLVGHESSSVRIALCVAMRKALLSNEENSLRYKAQAAGIVGRLLEDREIKIVLEAARVVHDVDVQSEMAKLAGLAGRINEFVASDALIRRIVSANARVGASGNAKALVSIARNEVIEEARRVEALEALGNWAAPPERDMVLHDWRPLDPGQRNVVDAKNALEPEFVHFASGGGGVTRAAITAAGNLKLASIGKVLEGVAVNRKGRAEERVASLLSLAKLKYDRMDSVLAKLESEFGDLPVELGGPVIELVSAIDEERAIKLIKETLANGQQMTQQSAISTLGKMKSKLASDMIAKMLKRMNENDFQANLRLDVSLAAAERSEESVKKQLAVYLSATADPDELVASFADTKIGGNDTKGSNIFYGKTEVSCVRCHRVDGTGGQVGPELSSIGKTKDRQYLLESIVHPNKVVAEGYTQIKVTTDEGELFVGIVKRETDESLVLLDADGKEIVIAQESIDDRRPGKSSMPADLINQLTKKEVRDLVEFLANRKSEPSGGEHE